MLFDSHSTNPSSSMVGTRPFGFMARYSGVRLPPNGPPTSTRSNGSPSSAQVQRAFMTLLDVVRPQIFSMERYPLAVSVSRRISAPKPGDQRRSAALALRLELEGERIHAETDTRRLRPVGEGMAQMRVAAAAQDFGANHAMALVGVQIGRASCRERVCQYV